MCIVVLNYDPTSDFPIMIGANREESTTRPISSPCIDFGYLDEDVPMRIVAGQDFGSDGTMKTPGTWLGFNEPGLTVAITNRDDGVIHGIDQLHSRGVLCYDLLRQEDSLSAVKFAVDSLMNGRYGGCNYLIADFKTAWIVHARGPEDIRTEQIHPGLHVLTNLDINDPNDRRVNYIHSLNKKIQPHDYLTSSEILITDPQWGTISSSIIEVSKENVYEKTIFMHSTTRPQGPGDYKVIMPFAPKHKI